VCDNVDVLVQNKDNVGEAFASPRFSSISIASLALNHFRNYTQLDMEVSPRSVVLTGANGAGKTNILEAISLLAPGRGLRSATMSELAKDGVGGHWAVSSLVRTKDDEVQLGTGVLPQMSHLDASSEKRIIKIDGELKKNQHILTAYFSCVWVTPAMGTMFIEGAGVRRRFLDRLVYSFDADHAQRVHAYEHTMRQRNKLLQDYNADKTWLDVLERKMAGYATAIAVARIMTMQHLHHAMAEASGAFPHAHLALSGDAESLLMDGMSAVAAESEVAKLLAVSRGVDARKGRSSHGAHKTELAVTFTEKNREAAMCSTGEQKALLMAIVMAHARARALWHGAAPVLLLDEVVAHLDQSRRKALFDELDFLGAQAWMTGTDAADFSAADGLVQCFSVADGRMTCKRVS
jgi:DNA replication and repair protein RecF